MLWIRSGQALSWIKFYLVSVYFVKHHRVINVKQDLLGGLKSRGDEIERVGGYEILDGREVQTSKRWTGVEGNCY